MVTIPPPTPSETQTPKPQPQPKNYGVSVNEYLQEDFKLPKMSSKTKERIVATQLTKEDIDKFDSVVGSFDILRDSRRRRLRQLPLNHHTKIVIS